MVFRVLQRESLQKIRYALPIDKAVATENGKMSLTEKRHVQISNNPR
jgi:hypothetical protein